MLVAGTRGDVQPLVALAKALVRAGSHQVTLCTTGNFADFVREQGEGLVQFAHCGLDAVEQPKEWLTATSMTQFMRCECADDARVLSDC